jgi:hypothetical protein
VETCPAWCADGHENDGHGMLDDLVHGSERVAMNLSLHVASTDGPAVWPVLSARVEVHPYSDRPEWGVPHVLLEASPDDVVESMSPEEFAAFIAAGRAHLDRLEAEVLGLVKAAVADHKGQAA